MKSLICVANVGQFLMGVALGLASLLGVAPGCADELSPSDDAVRAAVAKSLPLLERGARGSMEQRKQCFTCHNQGLPIMALTTAAARGFTIDRVHLDSQLQFVVDFLAKNKERYLAGKGQGGQVDTAGYALWALDNGGWKADATTAAVAEYFLRYQTDIPHWKPSSRRPPSEQSYFTSSYVALRGLDVFGTPEQKDRIRVRREQLLQWLTANQAQDTEDRVFRLLSLPLAGASEAEVGRARQELLDSQRSDGGWSQLDDESMSSDAYATGTALVALNQAGGVATSGTDYRRGLKYLISAQLDDGSWHVTSRSKPFQTYFESGYPHGTDQFISIAAAGWATTALALALSE